MTAAESHALWEHCNANFRDGKDEQALPDVLQLHQHYPGNHIYMEMAAEIYDRLGQYEKEAAFWEKYFDGAPNPETACPKIGEAYWKQGRQEQAIAALQRCVDRDFESSDSLFNLAHMLERKGDYARAVDLYKRGLKVSPDYTDMEIGIARILLRQGKQEEARSAITNVIRKAPNNVDALLVAGLVYARKGDRAMAKHYLEKGVALSEGYTDFHVALADIAESEHDLPEAIRQYDRILLQHPDDIETRKKRDALRQQQ